MLSQRFTVYNRILHFFPDYLQPLIFIIVFSTDLTTISDLENDCPQAEIGSSFFLLEFSVYVAVACLRLN
jgi:hypothetical protein